MTHDELLATIEELRFNSGADETDKNTDALRAVVELHKPEGIFCEFEAYEYPCPTIQAIEKELK